MTDGEQEIIRQLKQIKKLIKGQYSDQLKATEELNKTDE